MVTKTYDGTKTVSREEAERLYLDTIMSMHPSERLAAGVRQIETDRAARGTGSKRRDRRHA